MPATKPGGRRPPDAIERLYVYWIISTVLVLRATRGRSSRTPRIEALLETMSSLV